MLFYSPDCVRAVPFILLSSFYPEMIVGFCEKEKVLSLELA